jgi:hypothetical protein
MSVCTSVIKNPDGGDRRVKLVAVFTEVTVKEVLAAKTVRIKKNKVVRILFA